MATIFRVQIFRTGTHNGDTYTQADLDDMAEAFGRVGFRVPLKLGHTKDPGAPAIGWVENVRREGDILYGDLVDVDEEIAGKIAARRYGPVSSEVFWDLKRDGRTFRRVLGGVALLGADVPAVNLRPVWENLPAARAAAAAAEVRLYRFEVQPFDDPGEEVAARVAAMGEAIPYPQRFHQVLAADPALAQRYAFPTRRRRR